MTVATLSGELLIVMRLTSADRSKSSRFVPPVREASLSSGGRTRGIRCSARKTLAIHILVVVAVVLRMVEAVAVDVVAEASADSFLHQHTIATSYLV